MAVSTEVSKLFASAMSPDENNQLFFASKITAAIEPFPPPWIRSQFIPFISAWLPRNNKAILKCISDALPVIVKKAGALGALAPFIEALVSSEDTTTATSVEAAIKAYSKDPMVDELILALIPSTFDIVRAFVSRLLPFASTDAFKLKIVKKLCLDTAFVARLEISKFIPRLPDKAAAYFAAMLLKDSHPRIRACLPLRFVKSSFFISAIATPLAADPDWSVRACLCAQLPNSKDPARASELARTLIDDSVWQVRYSALRAYSALLSASTTASSGNSSVSVSDAPAVLDSLSNSLAKAPQSCLKTAAVDTFFGVAARADLPESALAAFSNSLLDSQPPAIRLHYLEGLAAAKKAALIEGRACAIVESLLKDDKWRIRLGTVKILGQLAEQLEKSAGQFLEYCKAATEDEAHPVKEAAMEHLATVYLAKAKEIPQWISEISKADTFRKRQAAVVILGMMAEKTDDKAFKKTLIAAIVPFTKDPCTNVSSLAQKYQ